MNITFRQLLVLVVHQRSQNPVLQGIDKEVPPRLSQLVEVIVDRNLDLPVAQVLDVLDTGEAIELLVVGLVLLAVGQVVGDVTVGNVKVLLARRLNRHCGGGEVINSGDGPGKGQGGEGR